MLIDPIEVLSEALPPMVLAPAPEALPPVADIEPMAFALALLPPPIASAPAPIPMPPTILPPPALTLLRPPEKAEPPSPPDLPLELTPLEIFDMLTLSKMSEMFQKNRFKKNVAKIIYYKNKKNASIKNN